MRVLATLSILASSVLFTQPASALEDPYSSVSGSGNVACLTESQETGYFTIVDNVVTGHNNCAGVASIPSGVTQIGNSAFSWAEYLTLVTIPNSVTDLGNYAFYRAARLTSVSLGRIAQIRPGTFTYATALASITIPSSVQWIGASAFEGTALTSLVIPDNVTFIGDQAFYGTSLQSVIIGNGVTQIADNAFGSNPSLSSLTLGNSLRNIGANAFLGPNLLTSLNLPNSVESLSYDTFGNLNLSSYRYCGSSLGSFSIYRGGLLSVPNSCTTIGSLYTPSIGSGDVACTSGFFTIVNNAVTRSQDCTGVANIPSGVTSIADAEAFGGTRLLNSVTIPNSLETIGSFAFRSSGLTTISLGSGLKTISMGAFFEADRLLSLSIPNSVTSIGSQAFQNATSLASVSIGRNVSSLGGQAFERTDALSEYSYCGTLLTEETLSALLGDKTRLCVASTASIATGLTPNSQVATFASGVTEAEIPATAALPSVKLNFSGTAPTAVTVVPMTSNPAPLTATPFRVTNSTKIVDIQITGTFNGEATVCLDGAPTDSVFHYTGGAWVELGSRSYANGQVCGVTTSFSPFTAAPANTNPSTPGLIVATTTGKRTATVSFTAPASDGGSAITSYTVTSTPGSITKTLTQAGSGAFSVTGLQPGTSYTFSVTAINSIGTSTATTSNSITTTAADVASLTAITFTDDGTGTAGKLTWSGKNIDAVLYTGTAASYPGPFTFGAFSTSWNGTIRNLTPDTQYTVSIFAISVDGIGESNSLTFKTGSGVPAGSGVAMAQSSSKLTQIISWVNQNSFVPGEAANISSLLTKFDALVTSAHRSYIKVPTSRVSKVEVKSLTPKACSVVSATAKVDAGLVTALTHDTCTISYTVSGASRAWATLVKDFTFKKTTK